MRGTRMVSVVALALLVLECHSGEPDNGSIVRGVGLPVASLPVGTRADVYTATVQAAFEVGPSLVLLLDPQLLPRTAGLGTGGSIPAELVMALRRSGTIQGTCLARVGPHQGAPECAARAPGYVVRFSDVFQRSGDSVQVHLEAERYRTSASGPAQAFRFEKAYQLVRQGERWRVVREGRVPDGA